MPNRSKTAASTNEDLKNCGFKQKPRCQLKDKSSTRSGRRIKSNFQLLEDEHYADADEGRDHIEEAIDESGSDGTEGSDEERLEVSIDESGIKSDDDHDDAAAAPNPAPVAIGNPTYCMEDLPAEIVSIVLEMLVFDDPRAYTAFCSTCRFVFNAGNGSGLRPRIIARIEEYSGLPWKRWLDGGIGPVFMQRHPPINPFQSWEMIRRLSSAVARFRDDRLHKVHVEATDRSGRSFSFCIEAKQSPNRRCQDLLYPMMRDLPGRGLSSVKRIVNDICSPLAGSQSLRSVLSLTFENFQ
eukprot:TRINITY_DN7743_c0_g1_i1.p1 TRINITY_DN7743_c0_g1~~TRINITY_DN7743_c0_g1_i1.p1  ORF type:complete len:297 (-),score=54.66 TRINITY_DN7743_c0_g1_i1:47-937(-)